MNAETRIRTPAEQALAGQIEALRPKLPGKGVIARLREEATNAFLQGGLPHRRIEEWKYTDLRSLLRKALPLAGPPAAGAIAAARKLDPLPHVDARRIVILNGTFVSELSDLSDLEPGLTIIPLARALAEDHPLIKRIGALAEGNYNGALALNTAFLNDGVIIEVAAKSATKRPIHIQYVCTEPRTAVFVRTLILVGDDAQAEFAETILESFSAIADTLEEYQTNIANEAYLGSRSRVRYVRIQEEGKAAVHLSTLLVELGAKANFDLCSLNTGAAVSRHSVLLRLAGEGSETRLASANLLRGKQHSDTTLVIDHALPGGKSWAINKSALDDESRGVFQGRIVVRPDAQKTDARMMTGALLLGEAAEADNKPELEIFADDVQCGHGATAGALDENLLFYLRARGIPRKEAEALMVESFVGEPLETIAHEGIREALAGRVRAWLAERR